MTLFVGKAHFRQFAQQNVKQTNVGEAIVLSTSLLRDWRVAAQLGQPGFKVLKEGTSLEIRII